MGSPKTWTVLLERDEPDGQSVWENCPFAVGLDVYLQIVTLPPFAVRMGDYNERQPRANPNGVAAAGPGPLSLPGPTKFVNGPVNETGPYPGTSWPLRVGCNLAVMPAWETSGVVLVPANTPAPTQGSNEGVDVRSLDVVEVWAAVAPGTPDLFRAIPWVRHPTGIWGVPVEHQVSASAASHRLVVPTRGADRLTVQITFTRPITAPGQLAYGRLTSAPRTLPAPADTYITPKSVIRFGAVEAPHQPRRSAEFGD